MTGGVVGGVALPSRYSDYSYVYTEQVNVPYIFIDWYTLMMGDCGLCEVFGDFFQH